MQQLLCLKKDEIDINDIWNFKITITEAQENRNKEGHLTGLLGNSANLLLALQGESYGITSLDGIKLQ